MIYPLNMVFFPRYVAVYQAGSLRASPWPPWEIPINSVFLLQTMLIAKGYRISGISLLYIYILYNIIYIYYIYTHISLLGADNPRNCKWGRW